jgi:hypothetical protein
VKGPVEMIGEVKNTLFDMHDQLFHSPLSESPYANQNR